MGMRVASPIGNIKIFTGQFLFEIQRINLRRTILIYFNLLPRFSCVPGQNRNDSPSKVWVQRQGGQDCPTTTHCPMANLRPCLCRGMSFLLTYGHLPNFVSLCSNAFIYKTIDLTLKDKNGHSTHFGWKHIFTSQFNEHFVFPLLWVFV